MSELKHEFSWKLAARPARVFAALTDADELTQWFAEHAEVELELGGAYRFWGKHTYGAPGREEANGKITKFAPSQALSYSWRMQDRDSEVRLTIEADPDNAEGCVLKGVHVFAEAPAISRAKEMVDDHWRIQWGNIAAHLAGGKGKLLPDYSDDNASINLSVFIDAPPSAVFRALIDPDKIQQWFGVPAEVDAREGGDWHLKMGEKSAPMKITDYVENERFAVSWPDWRGDKSVPNQRVLWVLKPEGGGTRVAFVHDGFVRAVDISDYPFGWGYFLSRITDVARGKAPDPVPEEHQC